MAATPAAPADAPAAAGAAASAGGFARLTGLHLSGCQLDFEQLQGLAASLAGQQQQQQPDEQQPEAADADPGSSSGAEALCAKRQRGSSGNWYKARLAQSYTRPGQIDCRNLGLARTQ